MLDWRQIPYVNWQPKVSLEAPALGEVLFGHLDVDQAIRAIVMTEKGTVPLEPEKCVRLMPWVDQPDATARPNIVRELFDAVSTYEPRVKLKSAQAKLMSAAQCRWLFQLSFYLTADVDRKLVSLDVNYVPA